MVQPGTSALFPIVDKVTPDKAIEALSRFGGRALTSSLCKEAERELQQALHRSDAVSPMREASPAPREWREAT
jgi:uncharacterized membrane protein